MKKTCNGCGKEKIISDFYSKKKDRNLISYMCKECDKEYIKRHSRSKRGMLLKMYSHQIESSIRRKHEKPSYTKEELVLFAMNCEEFHVLYDNWANSGYKKMMYPSFDRKNDYLPYSLENFGRWTTWEENKRRFHEDVKNGINRKMSKSIIGIDINNRTINFYYSIRSASRETKIARYSITQCVLGKRGYNSAGGMKWYTEEDYIKIFGDIDFVL